MTGKINHIELYVSDLERSAAFWSLVLESLGYTIYQQWEQGKSWRLSDQYIVFVQAEEPYLNSRYHRKQVGLNHIAFTIDLTSKLESICKALKDNGVQLLYTDKDIASNTIYFEDPDRIKVELVLRSPSPAEGRD